MTAARHGIGPPRYYRRMSMIQPSATERATEPLETVAPLDERAAAVSAAAMFRSMGDPARLAILRHLLIREHRVVELIEHLGLAQSTVSQHLACLRECGLVTYRPVGRASAYSVTQPELVTAFFAAAEQLLESTSDAAQACSTAGVR